MRTHSLTLLILLGIAAGAFYGQYVLFDPLNPIDGAHWTFIAGDLVLIRPLRMLVAPLMLVATISAVARINQLPRFGLALAGTFVYFAITMVLAAALGAGAAAFVRPGDLAPEVRAQLTQSAAPQFGGHLEISGAVTAAIDSEQDNLSAAGMNVLRRALPENLIEDITRGRTLGLIVLALLIGLALVAISERGRPVVLLFDALFEALLRIAGWLAWLAPVGALLLVANVVGSLGLRELSGIMQRHVGVIVGGLVAHMLIVLPIIMLMTARRNPYALLVRCGRALGVAFATASSLATLPVAMESALARGRPRRGDSGANAPGRSAPISRAAAGLVLPLGATLNLNGTALFQAASIVFLCQVYGLHVSINELVVIVITATLAAITTSGVPAAGLVTMIIVISAVNTSLGQDALPPAAIGILIGLDRLLDMCRTTVNVWGNLIGAAIITSIAPDESAAPGPHAVSEPRRPLAA